MLKLVQYLISQLVNHPDEIKVEETIDDTNTHILTASVDPSDMGKVIGKGGKIISAIRELLKVKAIKQGLRVRFVLKEPETATQIGSPSPSASSAVPPPAAQN